MRSSYSKLGDYIREVNIRNTDLSVTKLLGVSMEKTFISSVANIVGTDMSLYKVLKRGQFACKLMSVGRDEKLPVDLYKEEEDAIVSAAYYVFEVVDESIIHPEFLFMWLCRPENDRYIGYISGGDVRGGISWETFCSTPIRIPSIAKQREIVKEYNVIQNRITLNQQLIQKLEETAQAIYKEWFVEGVDVNWVKAEIKDFGNVVTGKTPSSENPEDFGNEMPFVTPGDFKDYNKFALGAERNLSEAGYKKLTNKILPSGSVIVTCIGSDMGKITIANQDCITNQQMNSVVISKTFYTDYLYYCLKSISVEIKCIAMGGSTMPMLSKSDFEKIEIIKPENNILLKFERVMKPFNNLSISYSKENQKLSELKELLLSKLAKVE